MAQQRGALLLQQHIIPPHHAVVPRIEIAFDAVFVVPLRRLVIIRRAGQAVAFLYYFQFHFLSGNAALPHAGDLLGM
jgi:hypothetical protein